MASVCLMQILFHPDAQAELIEGTNIYEANQQSLGYQFALEILAAVGANQDQPKLVAYSG